MADTSTVPATEYEREPVPEYARFGLSSFVGQYAGEHIAGTELMIGPLFLASGVSAFDLIVGLLLGNALAVLSWMVLTAPIATRARLTLYSLRALGSRRGLPLHALGTLRALAAATLGLSRLATAFAIRLGPRRG